MEEKGGNNKGFFSSLFSQGIKEAWKKIPLMMKIKIIGIIAIIIFVLIIIATVIGAVQSVFLDYSNDAQTSDEVDEIYNEVWGDICTDNSGNNICTEDQAELQAQLKEDQQEFYNKLDSLVKDYNISDEQKYLVLTTIFYDYDIYEFSMGNNAFELDSTNEINYDVNQNDQNVYVKEQDTLKELIKQFKVYTANCYHSYTDSNGNVVNDDFSLRDELDKTFTFNFWEYFRFSVGFGSSDEDFKKAKEECESLYGGSVLMIESSTNSASIENYYKYLLTTTYFDERPNLSKYFYDYGKKKGLNTNDYSTWPEEDLQNVRNIILENIKKIVKDYMGDVDTAIAYGGGSSYWWPIGSAGNDFIDTVSDLPENTTVTSNFQPARVIQSIYGNQVRAHRGIDLAGTLGKTNVIASLGGTVIKVGNSCASSNSKGCGGGFGNFIYVLDVKGNINIYAHLYKDSITVSVNDVVSQGQVIAKVGSSGNSTGAHLHFEIRINGVAVNPIQYISAENPRPVISDPYVVAEYVFNTLVAAGFSPGAAAGVLGNMYVESRFNPLALNSESQAYGLCQWLGTRKTDLKNYGGNDENKYSTVELQMQYLLEVDLDGQETFFQTYAKMSVDDYKKITEPTKAGELYCRAFERPGRTYNEVMNYDTTQRENISQAFYNRFVNSDMSPIGDLG